MISEVGPLFRVALENGERTAEVSGRLRHSAQSRSDLPAVGDWVAVRADFGASKATIFAVLPRRSAFVRKAAGKEQESQVVAANVDTVFLVTGLDLDFNVRRIERGLMLVRESGATPVIVLSKSDLCETPETRVVEVMGVAPNSAVVVLSAQAHEGLEALEHWLLPGKTIVLFGSSGTGKSTLVNVLLGEERQSTRKVRDHDHRGKHTTTRRELIVLPSGALLIDTPGVRELGLWAGDAAFEETFADIEAFAAQCAFSDCTHRTEPRCFVKVALAEGRLDQSRFDSFLKLKEELAAASRRTTRKNQKR